MKELSVFKRINLLKCCDIGSRMTHFGLPMVKWKPVRNGKTPLSSSILCWEQPTAQARHTVPSVSLQVPSLTEQHSGINQHLPASESAKDEGRGGNMAMDFILTPNLAVEMSAHMLRIFGVSCSNLGPWYHGTPMCQKQLKFIPFTDVRFDKTVLRNRSVLQYPTVHYTTL
jgi:hypothetical protein